METFYDAIRLRNIYPSVKMSNDNKTRKVAVHDNFDHNMVIDGFEFVRCLGRGGFATTYLYRDLEKKFGKYVAIKFPHNKSSEEALIQGDIFSLAMLRQHPNIVKIFGVMQVRGRYVLLMEYVEGPLLSELIGRPGTSPKLTVDQSIRYVLDVAKGLAAAHKCKMVHRDIKPENIIIDQAKDTAKILDFGIASLVSDDGFFETVNVRCTPAYTPMEVVLYGKGDSSVDIYSLGMVLYRLVTGTLPFKGQDIMRHEVKPKPPISINPAIPRYLNQAIMSAINPDPHERCHSMEHFISLLDPPPEIEHAKRHLTAGSVKRAQQVLYSLIRRQPDDYRGYMAMATLHSRCQRYSEAVKNLRKAVELDPFEPNLHLNLGTLLLKLNQQNEAIKELETAKKLIRDPKKQKQIKLLLRKIDHV